VAAAFRFRAKRVGGLAVASAEAPGEIIFRLKPEATSFCWYSSRYANRSRGFRLQAEVIFPLKPASHDSLVGTVGAAYLRGDTSGPEGFSVTVSFFAVPGRVVLYFADESTI
jgi:hypothetical protein